MEFSAKIILTIAVFLFSFVWYFKNYAAVSQWINDKLGVQQPAKTTKKKKAAANTETETTS